MFFIGFIFLGFNLSKNIKCLILVMGSIPAGFISWMDDYFINKYGILYKCCISWYYFFRCYNHLIIRLVKENQFLLVPTDFLKKNNINYGEKSIFFLR